MVVLHAAGYFTVARLRARSAAWWAAERMSPNNMEIMLNALPTKLRSVPEDAPPGSFFMRVLHE
jgi:hypothetical protein